MSRVSSVSRVASRNTSHKIDFSKLQKNKLLTKSVLPHIIIFFIKMVFYHIISWKISLRFRVYSSSITKAIFAKKNIKSIYKVKKNLFFFCKKSIICAKTIFLIIFFLKKNVWSKTIFVVLY